MLRSTLFATAAAVALAAGTSPLMADTAATTDAAIAPDSSITDIVRRATDLPTPLAERGPQHVTVNLETVEVTGRLDDGTMYRYWTFNEKVPGPFVRVRVGDTVTVNLTNADDSMMAHNVDFHAVTGPHGGGEATMAYPGESKSFTFRAMKPGLYVYHCATPVVAQHIANGMYGMILVEPEGGLREVDREFYVMQGEVYTEEAFGTPGTLTESYQKLMDEKPEYYVFNGAASALSGDNALKAETDETIRIFFGVGGPNKTSSFHVIGEIFDKVYDFASLTAEPLTDVQTITVPPGGAAMVEFKVEVPGPYVLVDHALSRAERGLKGILEVEGPARPDIFKDNNPEEVASAE